MAFHQVKVVSVSITLAMSLKSERVPLRIGDGEIASLLASKVMLYAGGNQVNDIRLCLYRKTENVPTDPGFMATTGPWQEDDSVLDAWLGLFDTTRTAECCDHMKWIYQVYPQPYLLIRQPSLLSYGSAANVYAAIILWYKLEKATDAELAQLMVKDHA